MLIFGSNNGKELCKKIRIMKENEKPVTESKKDAYAVLRISDFRNFLTAKFCLTFASQMQYVIVGWQVYEYTKDAFSLGLIGLAEAIPL